MPTLSKAIAEEAKKALHSMVRKNVLGAQIKADAFPGIVQKASWGKKKPEEVAQKLENAAAIAQRMTAKHLGHMLVMRSPIKTGRTRANWIASLRVPNTSYSAPPPYGENGRPGPGWGEEIVARNNAIIDGAVYGEAIYFRNSVPYLRRLEETGWSRQAPDGWIRLAAYEIRESQYYARAFISAYRLGREPKRFT